MLIIFTIIFLYIDIAIDTKDRVLLLSDNPPRVTVLNDSSSINLDSIFHPTSLSTAPFSIWVASGSENLIQKYSLKGEYLGSISFNSKDLDADRNGLLIAGEYSLLIELSSGREIPIIWKESNRCALDDDYIYLYGDDTLYLFERSNRRLINKEFIPDIRDLSIWDSELVFLKNDSIFISDTSIFIQHARRIDTNGKQIWVLSDTVVSISPKMKHEEGSRIQEVK